MRIVRRRQLRARFDPEYDRTVAEKPHRAAAESDLRAREKPHAELDLKALSPQDRDRYLKEWSHVQAAEERRCRGVRRDSRGCRRRSLLTGAAGRRDPSWRGPSLRLPISQSAEPASISAGPIPRCWSPAAGISALASGVPRKKRVLRTGSRGTWCGPEKDDHMQRATDVE